MTNAFLRHPCVRAITLTAGFLVIGSFPLAAQDFGTQNDRCVNNPAACYGQRYAPGYSPSPRLGSSSALGIIYAQNFCAEAVDLTIAYAPSSNHWETIGPFGLKPYQGPPPIVALLTEEVTGILTNSTVLADRQSRNLLHRGDHKLYFFAESASRRWEGEAEVRVGEKTLPMREADHLITQPNGSHILQIFCN